jgi:hypothetical protein
MRKETRNKTQIDALHSESSFPNKYNKYLSDAQDENYSETNYHNQYLNTEDGSYA